MIVTLVIVCFGWGSNFVEFICIVETKPFFQFAQFNLLPITVILYIQMLVIWQQLFWTVSRVMTCGLCSWWCYYQMLCTTRHLCCSLKSAYDALMTHTEVTSGWSVALTGLFVIFLCHGDVGSCKAVWAAGESRIFSVVMQSAFTGGIIRVMLGGSWFESKYLCAFLWTGQQKQSPSKAEGFSVVYRSVFLSSWDSSASEHP